MSDIVITGMYTRNITVYTTCNSSHYNTRNYQIGSYTDHVNIGLDICTTVNANRFWAARKHTYNGNQNGVRKREIERFAW